MKKKEAVGLYFAVQSLKNGAMAKETLYSFAKLRLKLRQIAKEFEDLKEQVEDSKNGKGVIDKWLAEEIEIEKLFTFEEIIDLCQHNDTVGQVQDEILTYLLKG